ncbi:MAG: hypothetical protein FJ291_32715 [Planctomycetes bacterium]|nr:hypothetical protein [Planctomycetota bacterium]
MLVVVLVVVVESARPLRDQEFDDEDDDDNDDDCGCRAPLCEPRPARTLALYGLRAAPQTGSAAANGSSRFRRLPGLT